MRIVDTKSYRRTSRYIVLSITLYIRLLFLSPFLFLLFFLFFPLYLRQLFDKCYFYLLQAQSDDDDVADEVSVNVGGPDDFMTEFFAEVSWFLLLFLINKYSREIRFIVRTSSFFSISLHSSNGILLFLHILYLFFVHTRFDIIIGPNDFL